MAITELLPREEALTEAGDSLAHAYLTDFNEVSSFYAGDFRGAEILAKRGKELLGANAFELVDRPALLKKLLPALRALDAPAESIAAAKRLAEADCLCVVAGQQPGIAGGPALLLYKAAHVVRLAQELGDHDLNVVPIFWAASEDHDIDEVNSFCAFNREGKFRNLRVRALPSGTNIPLEKMHIPGPDDPDIKAIEALIGEGPAKLEALELLRASVDADFGRGLNRMLLKLFGKQGLVVIEPRMLRGLRGFRTCMMHELVNARDHQIAVDTRLTEIRDMGYALPLAASPYTNMFHISRGKRRHVLRVAGGFTIEGGEEPLTRAELQAELDQHPERFSANVRLRPVVQGACLPTLAYVGGPAEIAYHGALKPLFDYIKVPMPTLLPRWSFLLASGASETGAVRDAIQEQSASARRAAAAISETGIECHAVLNSLKQGLGQLANPLAGDIDRLFGRVEKTLGELRGRLLADPLAGTAVERQYGDEIRWLYPDNAPQERVLSWLSVWPAWRDTLREVFEKRSAFDFSLAVVKRE